MQKTSQQDVLDLIASFRIGWSTSNTKIDWLDSRLKIAECSENYYAYQKNINDITNRDESSHQTTQQALDGFPLLRVFIKKIDENVGVIKSLEKTYAQLRKQYPDLKVGILADQCASALFLHLSFKDPEEYRIF